MVVRLLEIKIGEIIVNEEVELDSIIAQEELEFEGIEPDTLIRGDNDYNKLKNKPSINNMVLTENKSLDELGIQEKGNYANERVTNLEIDNLF